MTCRLAAVLIACIAFGGAHRAAANPVANPDPPAPQVQESAADRQLRQLYEAEWAWRLQQMALETRDGQSIRGDHLPSMTAASHAARLAYWNDVLARLDAIDFAQLSHRERINAVVFRTWIGNLATEAGHRTYEAPFEGAFWNYLSEAEGFSRAVDYRAYLGRMRDIPRYFDEQIANMRAGLRRGFTAPREAIQGYDRSIEAFLAADADNPFYPPFAHMPPDLPAEQRQALQREAVAVIREQVVPSYRRLLAFMRDEYLPRARTTIAAEALPDGKRYYRDRIREFTTLDLDADTIHRTGLAEVARIQAGMHRAMADTGFKGSFAEFLHFLRTDPQFHAKTPRELLERASYVAKRMDGKVNEMFGLLPRHRFTIAPVPDAIAPYYAAGAGGVDACLINTHDLASRPLYNLTALTLHECIPGHSWQQAVALENGDNPAFFRDVYFSASSEGWALYAEWLGTRLGMYETPYDEFGRLSYEMLRAARLVIDTGIHAKGWSRQQAIDYLAAHSALSASEIAFEVDRYILWPGQALSYKVGEMTIRRLRARAEAELGEGFDVRRFHDMILALGSVPLTLLEQETGRFIAAEKERLGRR